MKKWNLLILIVACNIMFAQNADEKEDALVPEINLNIWDEANSVKTFKIDSLLYDEIPKYLDFRGAVVEALKWNDDQGENILVLSKSGDFGWKEYDKSNTDEFQLQDRSEIFVYLFQKEPTATAFQQKWRIYDYTDCFGVDMYAGFKRTATTITDVDGDGMAEIAIPYLLMCRGGMDPGVMKIIMYEADQKFAIRGETAICRDGEVLYGGTFKVDAATSNNEIFLDFLKDRWEVLRCE